MMKKILVLFPNDWDKVEFSKEKYADSYQFVYAGTDFFKFPGLLKLPFLKVRKLTRSIIQFVEKNNFDGILSSDEYIGAIIAAAVSQQTGLPGTDPEKIILAQHKYFSRLIQSEHCPEASVGCALIPQMIPRDFQPELDFPFFVKPVKGTFSLFAKKVDDMESLKKHMNFNWYERLVLRTITRPFNHLITDLCNLGKDANFFVAEELIRGVQVTVDGFAWDGQVTICGVTDSFMFEGTNIFERFEYPSRLPAEVIVRMEKVVQRLIAGMEFRVGQFNVELFYNEEYDTIKIIEINPRLSYQFADLFENVDGTSTYQILIDLALGNKPAFQKGAGEFIHTASFVLRTFQGKELRAIPTKNDVEAFASRYPETNIKIYGKVGTKLSNEMRAIGSYRYGIVNVGAHSLLDLFSIYEDVLESLPFKFK